MNDVPVFTDEPAVTDWMRKSAVYLLRETYARIAKNTDRLTQKRKLKIKRVHSTRIDLRRLRSQLSNVKLCFGCEDYELMKTALKNYNQVLAGVREMDVFAIELAARMQQSYTQAVHRGLMELTDLVVYKRQDLNAQLLEANSTLMASEGWGILEAFLDIPIDDFVPSEDVSVMEEFINSVINQRIEEILESQGCLQEETPGDDFHQLRIKLKGLRYTLEDFSQFGIETFEPALKHLRPIQDCMGMIHDRQMWLDAVQVFFDEAKVKDLPEEDRRNLLQVLDLFQQEWQLEITNQYHAFQKLWQYLERDGFWENLKTWKLQSGE